MNEREARLGQLAMKGGVILTAVSPVEFVQGGWTKFTDIWAGGCAKEPWDYIFIQAPVPVACCVFEHVFGHDPRNSSCACCGEEYEISPAGKDADYGKSLFIKAADILAEWTKPLEDPHEKEVHFPGGVTIKYDDLFKSPYSNSKNDVDYEHLIQANAKLISSALGVPEQFLATMSAEALEGKAVNFGLPAVKPEPKLVDPNKFKISVAGQPISFTNPPFKEELPPGMHYAYDDIAAKQKKKR